MRAKDAWPFPKVRQDLWPAFISICPAILQGYRTCGQLSLLSVQQFSKLICPSLSIQQSSTAVLPALLLEELCNAYDSCSLLFSLKYVQYLAGCLAECMRPCK
eukprot:scaffold266451_cov22-Tisochrysis_lutea.AAC.1